MNSMQNMERMYPDVYNRMYPFVLMEANRFPLDMELTDDMLNNMSDEIIRKSGLEAKDEMEKDATTVQQGFGRHRGNREPVRDIARILLLRELAGRRRSFPFWFFPFI